MIQRKKICYALVIALVTFQFGCGNDQLFHKEIDTNGDGKIDLVRYFNGDRLIKEETLEPKGSPKIVPRVFYFKAPVSVEVEGKTYLQQEMDIRRTFGQRATDVRGTSFIYTRDRDVLFSKSFFGNGKVDSIVLAGPSGATERTFENFDMDDDFDMFTLYDPHQKPRMAKISILTTTTIAELRKFIPPPDSPGPEIKDPTTGKWFVRYDFRDQNKLVPVSNDSNYVNEIMKPFVIPKNQPEKK